MFPPAFRTFAAVFAMGALACAADESDVPTTREEAEKSPEKAVMATFSGGSFTLADVTAAIAQRGALAQERYQAPQAKLAFLESLLDFEVLAREATARRFHEAPVVQRAFKSALAQALWEKGQLPGAGRDLLTEERLVAYHTAHHDEFREPETARVSHLLVKLPETRPIEARTKARAAADKLLAELRAHPDDARFADFARRHSDDDATRTKGGDLGTLMRGAEEGELPRTVLEAAFTLPLGVVAKVESPLGVHLVRVASRAPGKPSPFAAVRKKVEARVWQELRQEAMKRLLESLRAKAKIEKLAAPRLVPLPEKRAAPAAPAPR